MICRRCQTRNTKASRFCSKCGKPLTRGRASAVRRLILPYGLAAVGAALIGGYFLYTGIRRQSPGESTAATATESMTSLSPAGEGGALPFSGVVIVRDGAGAQVSRWETWLFNDVWVALPLWAFFDDGSPVFQSGDADGVPLERAFWAGRGPIVLCRLETGEERTTPRLAPWDQGLALRWRSLRPAGPYLQVENVLSKRSGPFLHIPLPEELKEPGVFLQEGRIVGWTLGRGVERGYLWAGPAGEELSPNTRVGPLRDRLMANGREARFRQALAAEGKYSPEEAFEAFSEGFHRVPQLAVEDTPSELRPQAISARMHAQAAELIRKGLTEDVVRVLDDQLLLEALDPALVKDAALARVAKDRGQAQAIEFLLRVRKRISEGTGKDLPGLGQFHARLYKDWMKKVLDTGGADRMEVYEKACRAFPDDPEVHLLGVELAIAEHNWSRATEILRLRDYPAAMKDRVQVLEDAVKEGWADQGVATVRFNPGEKNISVYASLNKKFVQKFIIDTGAEMTMIPLDAAEALGIRIDESTPPVLVTGVGMDVAYEVILDSVELMGQSVSNVKVLVLDISPEFGLLGINFLNNFHIQIDNQKGILRLRKKQGGGSPEQAVRSADRR